MLFRSCRLAASSNRVGRSPTGGPLIRPAIPCRRVNAGKPFCVKPAKRFKRRRCGDVAGRDGARRCSDIVLCPATWAALGFVTLLLVPFAIRFGVIFFGESRSPQAYLGFGLVALGMVVLDGRVLAKFS